MAKLPFYSRKYGTVFKSFETFQWYDKKQKRKWVVEKHAQHQGKTYSPSKLYYDTYHKPRY